MEGKAPRSPQEIQSDESSPGSLAEDAGCVTARIKHGGDRYEFPSGARRIRCGTSQCGRQNGSEDAMRTRTMGRIADQFGTC